MKLHLGCGQVYLDGYTNIDYPLTEHTAQTTSVADEYADLLNINYKCNTIDEVRLHHVFEHFPRYTALALVASWVTWLKKGGVLHIEVPDFDETAKLALDKNLTYRERKVALRHIFGSNEADWAVHYDGWSAERLEEVCKLFGLKNIKIEKTEYLTTRNVTVIAESSGMKINAKKAHELAYIFMKNYTLNESETELTILNVWLDKFDKQFAQSCAK